MMETYRIMMEIKTWERKSERRDTCICCDKISCSPCSRYCRNRRISLRKIGKRNNLCSSHTYYTYSPLGEVQVVRDADGYETRYKYDGLGRMIERNHPDAGMTRWYYDDAGNVISRQTENARVRNDYVHYVYDYNRLQDVVYSYRPEDNVHYDYDAAGRVAQRTDGTGSESFTYDELGNINQSIRRIILPSEDSTYVFKTCYLYDSFGRMRSIIYPDGETVQYSYTDGGLLDKVTGYQNGQTTHYLASRRYDEQGRVTRQIYGNQVITCHTYDPLRQWLTHLQTITPTDTLQELDYAYDHVGNITAIVQSARKTESYMGGEYQNTYLYNKQYRLTQSDGDGSFPYRLRAKYSSAGRLGHKFCAGIADGDMDVTYGYDSRHLTHQPRTIFDIKSNTTQNLYWDMTGNLSQVVDSNRHVFRFHEWDAENRLRFFVSNDRAGYYGYDGNGERVYKITGMSNVTLQNNGDAEIVTDLSDVVLYPNPYISVTSMGYTKHYFAGTERIATRIGDGGFKSVQSPTVDRWTTHEKNVHEEFYMRYEKVHPWDNMVRPANETNVAITGIAEEYLQYTCTPYLLMMSKLGIGHNMLYSCIDGYSTVQNKEKSVFYYHGDHLGSASWITDTAGTPVQYIHYAPYGELIAEQRYGNYDERFKFTGKERDKESQYDYFGARFYWSRFTHFNSPDPLLDKYLYISPYAYCNWNPIKYIDPDGKRSTLSVNYRTNTITISAKYYASSKDFRYAKKAANFWNEQKGLTYTAGDGKVYSVQFALSVFSSKNPNKAAGTDDNSFKIVNTLGTNAEGNKKTGETKANYQISVADAYKDESTGAHEIGHTLMNVSKEKGSEHADTGVMTKSISDEGRSWSVSQETVNNIVESNGFNQNPTLWQRIKSWFE